MHSYTLDGRRDQPLLGKVFCDWSHSFRGRGSIWKWREKEVLCSQSKQLNQCGDCCHRHMTPYPSSSFLEPLLFSKLPPPLQSQSSPEGALEPGLRLLLHEHFLLQLNHQAFKKWQNMTFSRIFLTLPPHTYSRLSSMLPFHPEKSSHLCNTLQGSSRSHFFSSSQLYFLIFFQRSLL